MPADPPRCEPPEEARGERWHWLRHDMRGDVPAIWTGVWEIWRTLGFRSCREAAAAGYRWLAVAKPSAQQEDEG